MLIYDCLMSVFKSRESLHMIKIIVQQDPFIASHVDLWLFNECFQAKGITDRVEIIVQYDPIYDQPCVPFLRVPLLGV